MAKTKTLTKDIVEQVLRDREATRNSRQTLCTTLRNMGYSDEKNRGDDGQAIYRWARDIQNKKGLYKSTAQIERYKKQQSQLYKQEFTPTKHDLQQQVLQHLIYRQQTIS